MRAEMLFFIIIGITLTSCEGFLHMQGIVYDNNTRQPVTNAAVILILKGKDTIRNTQFEYDTIDYNNRISLRKKGLKDDFTIMNVGGLSKKPVPSVTDSSGFFSVGTLLVPCVPKCPKCELLIVKEGYEPVSVKINSIVQDSMRIDLKKLTDTL